MLGEIADLFVEQPERQRPGKTESDRHLEESLPDTPELKLVMWALF